MWHKTEHLWIAWTASLIMALMANPGVEFHIGASRSSYETWAADAPGNEDSWPLLCEVYPEYDDYQAPTDREVYLVVFDPSANVELNL